MKHFRIIILSLFFMPLMTFAQDIAVKSFQALPMDMTASSPEGKRIDQNGIEAALIKMVTTEQGFTFEGGTLGIVDTKQKDGEIWVWVPRGARKITIKHQQLGVLRDYRYPLEITEGKTYRMELTVGTVETVVKEEVRKQYLSFQIEPHDATLWVNDEEWEVDEDGGAINFLDFGTYTYRVQAPGCQPDAGKVTLDDASVTKEVSVNLNPLNEGVGAAGKEPSVIKNVEVQFTCNIPDAQLEIDGQKMKSASGFYVLSTGQHSVRASADNYQDHTTIITVSESSSRHDIVMIEKGAELFTVNGVSFKMRLVEGGTFMMGATSEQGDDAWGFEKPIHSVTISTFMMGETEVTQALWQAVMGSNPSNPKGDNLPVYRVSWNDCQEFIRKLNQKTGRNFRLPTEAEWEYAARGGKNSKGYKFAGSNNADDVAWYDKSFYKQPVKTKSPNELGLYDMSGNVSEWCNDWYDSDYYSSSPSNNPQGPSKGSSRIRRGGDGLSRLKDIRVSSRSYAGPKDKYESTGLRLCLPQ